MSKSDKDIFGEPYNGDAVSEDQARRIAELVSRETQLTTKIRSIYYAMMNKQGMEPDEVAGATTDEMLDEIAKAWEATS